MREPLPPSASDREFLDTQFPPTNPGVILVQYHKDQILRLLKIADKSLDTLGELFEGWDYYDPADLIPVVERARANLPLASVETLTLKAQLGPGSLGSCCLQFVSDDLCQYETWGYFAQEKIINALHLQPGEIITVTFTKKN